MSLAPSVPIEIGAGGNSNKKNNDRNIKRGKSQDPNNFFDFPDNNQQYIKKIPTQYKKQAMKKNQKLEDKDLDFESEFNNSENDNQMKNMNKYNIPDKKEDNYHETGSLETIPQILSLQNEQKLEIILKDYEKIDIGKDPRYKWAQNLLKNDLPSNIKVNEGNVKQLTIKRVAPPSPIRNIKTNNSIESIKNSRI